MKTLSLIAFLSVSLSIFTCAHCASHQLADSQTRAAQEKKDVLLVFTGSAWQGASKKLNEEILSSDVFKKEAAAHFVTHVLDYPQKREETGKPLLSIRQKYQAQRLPLMVLTDAMGRPYAYAGFRPGGVEGLMKNLKAGVAKREKRDEAFAKAQKAKGLEKAKALVEGLEQVPQQVWRDFYEMELVTIAQNDPKGETGLIARLEKTEALRKEQDYYQTLFRERKFEKIIKDAREAAAKAKGEDAQRLSMYAVQALVSEKKYKEAKKEIETMAAFAPESNFGKSVERYKQVVDRIKARNERQAQAAQKPKSAKPAGPIVSKPVAVVTDLNQLLKEVKDLDQQLKAANQKVSTAAQAQQQTASKVAKLEAELKVLKEAGAKSAVAMKQATEARDKLAKKTRLMKEVVENHRAMERRKKTEVSDLEKKANELQKKAEELRKKAKELQKNEK